MKIVTDHVHPDEAAYGYFTGPKVMPGYSEDENPRMIEQVFVIRGDTIACYERDFGSADDFPYVPPMMIPSYGENNVGFLQEMGEHHRQDERWGRRMREYKESSTLFADIIRQEEQRHLIIKNHTSIGPGGNFQRNGYSHETAVRRYKDELKRRSRRQKYFL